MDRKDRGVRSIFSAVLDDDLDLLRSLLEPVPVEIGKHSTLYKSKHALKSGKSHSPVIKTGAPISIVNDRDDTGATALHLCAAFGSARCARELISEGADIHARDAESGWTPLHTALYRGNINVAGVLLAAGAKLDGTEMLFEQRCKRLKRDVSRWTQHCLEMPKSATDGAVVDNEGLSPLDLLTKQLRPVYDRTVRAIDRTHRVVCKLPSGKRGRAYSGGRAHNTSERPWNESDSDDAEDVELDSSVFGAMKEFSPSGVAEERVETLCWPPIAAIARRYSGTQTQSATSQSAQHTGRYHPSVMRGDTCITGMEPVRPCVVSHLVSFGRSDYQLGYSTSSDVQIHPRVVDLPHDHATDTLISIIASKTGSAVITADGVPLVFGVNAGGRLGIEQSDTSGRHQTTNTLNVVLTPTAIPFFIKHNVKIIKMALGDRHSLALDAGGCVWAWGDNRAGQCGLPNPHTSTHSKAKASKVGTQENDTLPNHILTSPLRVEGALKRGTTVDVAAGGDHSVALNHDGYVFSWGSNAVGQLCQRDVPMLRASAGTPDSDSGFGDARETSVFACLACNPRKVDVVHSDIRPRFRSIQATDASTMAVSADGEVYEGGRGKPFLRRVVFDVAAAAEEDMIAQYTEGIKSIDSVGEVREDVLDSLGRLGFATVGAGKGSSDTAWVHHDGGKNMRTRSACIVQVSVSKTYALALDDTGCIWWWGTLRRSGKECDVERSSEHLGWCAPRRVSALSRQQVMIKKIATGAHHWLALTEDGDVFASGDTYAVESGLLAAASGAVPADCPRRIPSIKRATDIAAGDTHSLIITSIILPPLPPHRSSSYDIELRRESDCCPASHLAADVVVDADVHRLYGSIMNDDDMHSCGKLSSDSSIGGFVPSLQSICERVLAPLIDPVDCVHVLSTAQDLQAEGLACYCASILMLNLDWYLASLRPKHVGEFEASTSRIERFQWTPANKTLRLYQHDRQHQQWVRTLGKNIKRYFYQLMRPSSMWRAQGQAVAGDINASGHGRELFVARDVPPLLAAETAREVARIKASLFPASVSDVALLVSKSAVKTPILTATPTTTDKEEGKRRMDDGLAPSFTDAYEAIVACRQASSPRTGFEERTGTADPNEDSASLRRLAASAAAARMASAHLPASAPPSVQSCLDRVASYLIEVNRAPKKVKHYKPLSDGWHDGASAAGRPKVPLTSLMLDNAFVLLRRTKTLRKKLIESTQLAQQLVLALRARPTKFGAIGMTPDQISKALKRSELVTELWTVAPFIDSVLKVTWASVSAGDISDEAEDCQRFIKDGEAAIKGFRELCACGLGPTAVEQLKVIPAPSSLPIADCCDDVLVALNDPTAAVAGFAITGVVTQRAATSPPTQLGTISPQFSATAEPFQLPPPARLPKHTPAQPSVPEKVWTTKSVPPPTDLRAHLKELSLQSAPAAVPSRMVIAKPVAPAVVAKPDTAPPATKPRSLKEILAAEEQQAQMERRRFEAEAEMHRKAAQAEAAKRKAEMDKEAEKTARLLGAFGGGGKGKKVSLADIQQQQRIDAELAESHRAAMLAKRQATGSPLLAAASRAPLSSAWVMREKTPWKMDSVADIVAKEEQEAKARDAAEREKADAALAMELHRQALQRAFSEALSESKERGVAKGILPPDVLTSTSEESKDATHKKPKGRHRGK